jgi:genome maintenance exonuclease 1
MKFTHYNPYNIPKLTRVTENGNRYYLTPDGKKYPSVTTVAGIFTKQKIVEWRKRVGNEQATKITTQASVRGTAVHKLCEDYINNVEDYTKGQMPVNVDSFNSIKPIIDSCINNVVMQECPLYSHYLKVAGTVDCIAEWNGKLSIIDFKTSRKPKKLEWIENYFMQTAAYAVMFEELTEKPITDLVILISVDNEEPQIFTQKRDEWISKFMEARDEFKNRYGY